VNERDLELLRRLSAAVRREEARPSFLDGLLLGAMVGAAIAGSTIWRRRRARQHAGETEGPAVEESPQPSR
jgi:hypothetical protein